MPPLAANRMAHWACEPPPIGAWERVLDEVRPEVVHIHATLQVHPPEFLRAAKTRGARIVWTYHAAGQTCLQTALLRDGVTPCDGEVRADRCTRCGLVWSGLPGPVASVFGALDLHRLAPLLPNRLRHPFERRRGTELFKERLGEAFELVDAFTAHAGWAERLLLANGLPQERVHRLPLPPPADVELTPDPSPWAGLPAGLRVLYVGRLQDIKGPHVLLEALRGPLAAERALAVAFLGAPGEVDYGERFRRAVALEPRARLHFASAIDPLAAMAAADVVVVPSLCLETGPFTVLEARWAGAAVAGSDLGGIAEQLVGVSGARTFPPGDPVALASALLQLRSGGARSREAIAGVRAQLSGKFDDALAALVRRLERPQAASPASTR